MGNWIVYCKYLIKRQCTHERPPNQFPEIGTCIECHSRTPIDYIEIIG